MIRFVRLLCASALILVPNAGFAQQVVGAVGAANAAPTGRAPGQATRALRPGGDIFFKDRIATKRGGSAQLTFLDRSTLSVGENSDLVIDEFVYDPGASGTMRASLSKGVLRFVGGDISHAGGATINTPAVTIGIRGGIGTIGYVKDGADLDAIPGVPANFHGGAIVVNGYGQMTVRNRASEIVLSRPGFALFVGSAGESIAAPVRLDPRATEALMKALASKGRQRGGASTKVAAAFAGAGIGHKVEVPVALPLPPTLDALDFTSVFSVGDALARNQAQSNQASQLRLQIMHAATASMSATTASATTATTSNSASATAATSSASTPNTSTASAPAASAASTPTTSTASTPTTSTASTPTMTTASTPNTSTATTPTPSTASSASSSSTPTSVQTVYDINVAVVTADVIYAHIIDSGHIQAQQVIYGTSYGSTSGSTVNGSNLTTTGQLNAHDIHAGTVIANVIYVDSVN